MPEPLTVLVVNATVGLADVLQQTPLAVTLALPPLVTLPPLLAVVVAIADAAVVVTVAAEFDVPGFQR